MKKMKKLLSVLLAITVISTTAIINTSAAYVPSYVAPEDVVSIADTYPDVETLDELKEMLTEITPIYYEEYYLLLENLTEEELYEYFESNGVENGDADTYLEDAVFLYSALTKVSCLMSISDKLYSYRHYRENSLMNEAKRDNSVYAHHQLEILKRIIVGIKGT